MNVLFEQQQTLFKKIYIRSLKSNHVRGLFLVTGEKNGLMSNFYSQPKARGNNMA
jgi:hypothetical protein